MVKNVGVPHLQLFLKQLREEKGISRKALADEAAFLAVDPEAPVTERQIQQLEQCQTVPPPEILVPVCQALGAERDVVLDILGLSW